ncbi:hypothetical protein BLNAU_4833 [Blattamonas nauphoetae]|uniref:Uncharacterized protein n=1 Tax=Blattamonas nauphoetae TaxID=2049346 RepID=A0ABQ9Y951_9EUKA|nr:hypothetical protein BLNAU_4833 [Blattamonas nauphoetae]
MVYRSGWDSLSPVSLDGHHTLHLLRCHSSIVDGNELLLFMLVDFRPFINLMLSSHTPLCLRILDLPRSTDTPEHDSEGSEDVLTELMVVFDRYSLAIHTITLPLPLPLHQHPPTPLRLSLTTHTLLLPLPLPHHSHPPTPLRLSLTTHTLPLPLPLPHHSHPPLPSASPSPPTPSHSPLPLPHHPHPPTPLCLSLTTNTLPLPSASPSPHTPSHSSLPLPHHQHPPTPLCLSLPTHTSHSLCLSLTTHTLPLPLPLPHHPHPPTPSASPSPPTPSHSPLPLPHHHTLPLPLPLPHHPHPPTPLCLSLTTHTLPLPLPLPHHPHPPTPLCLSLTTHTLPLPSASPSPPTPSHSPLPLHSPHSRCQTLGRKAMILNSLLLPTARALRRLDLERHHQPHSTRGIVLPQVLVPHICTLCTTALNEITFSELDSLLIKIGVASCASTQNSNVLCSLHRKRWLDRPLSSTALHRHQLPL